MGREQHHGATWPGSVCIDAACDSEPCAGRLSPAARAWALGRPRTPAVRESNERHLLRPGSPADPTEWQDERVGWGVVLAEKEGLSKAALANGDDAPEPIRQLLAHRREQTGALPPVLRYRPSFDAAHRHLFLRDWRHGTDVLLDRPAMGTRPGHLPFYLLIAASPEEVPWSLQYVLNAGSCVGRLHFDGPEAEIRLGRYVEHSISGWGRGAGARQDRALAWAVDHGGGDITTLLRQVIAMRTYKAWNADADIEATLLDGRRGEATAGALARTLAEQRPGLVLGTSHGRTAPLDDPRAMAARLGLPVDQDDRDVEPEELLRAWQPGGALWVAWGCCTAGSSSDSLYSELFDEGSPSTRVLSAVAALGDRISPLPQALLGAESPLRAFVGQVEPTFDWTLRHPSSRADMAKPLADAFYEHLYQPWPIGYALRRWYEGLGRLYTAWERTAADAVDSGGGGEVGEAALRTLLYLRLAARDIESTVILGDPTVCLPPLP